MVPILKNKIYKFEGPGPENWYQVKSVPRKNAAGTMDVVDVQQVFTENYEMPEKSMTVDSLKIADENDISTLVKNLKINDRYDSWSFAFKSIYGITKDWSQLYWLTPDEVDRYMSSDTAVVDPNGVYSYDPDQARDIPDKPDPDSARQPYEPTQRKDYYTPETPKKSSDTSPVYYVVAILGAVVIANYYKVF